MTDYNTALWDYRNKQDMIQSIRLKLSSLLNSIMREVEEREEYLRWITFAPNTILAINDFEDLLKDLHLHSIKVCKHNNKICVMVSFNGEVLQYSLTELDDKISNALSIYSIKDMADYKIKYKLRYIYQDIVNLDVLDIFEINCMNVPYAISEWIRKSKGYLFIDSLSVFTNFKYPFRQVWEDTKVVVHTNRLGNRVEYSDRIDYNKLMYHLMFGNSMQSFYPFMYDFYMMVRNHVKVFDGLKSKLVIYIEADKQTLKEYILGHSDYEACRQYSIYMSEHNVEVYFYDSATDIKRWLH